MGQLIKALQDIGLTEKEAMVYLALLQLGPSNPYQISKHSGLKRPTAYVISEELTKKNYIVQAPGQKHIYIARTPELLFEEYEKKLINSKRSLPELLALKGGTGDKPNILYYDGVEGLKQAMMYRLKEFHDTEIVGFYADPELTTKESMEASTEYNEYRVAHNITTRALLTESSFLKPFAKYLEDETFTPKFLPKEEYSSNASFEFYPNLIKIIFYDTAVSVIIESPTAAKAMRQIFEILWSRLGGEYQKSKVIK